MENPVIIFGAGNIGRLALDIFNSNNVLTYGFLDDNKALHNTEISETMVLGDPFDDGFLKFIGNKTEAFVAVDNKVLKTKIVEMLLDRRKTMPVNAIHASATVSEDAEIGHGILIGPGAIINPGTKIGNHVLIQSRAVVEVGCTIGEYTEIGTGAIINADVEVGEGAFIGTGAVLVGSIKIGKNARVGAGSVVIDHVKENDTVFGNPAKSIKQ
jgi:sugar O-acyltransferase (sialic acid O-acetyltransferase NeuD family)